MLQIHSNSVNLKSKFLDLRFLKLRKGERTQINIIKNAIRLFAYDGYDSTSVQSIADASGVSQAAVFQHFKNKKVLLSSIRTFITEDVTTYVSKRFKADMSAKESLFEYLIGNLEWAVKNRDMSQMIFLSYYMACFNDEFHQHRKDAVKIAEERVLKMVYSCQREGDLDSKRSPEIVSKQVHGFLMGLSFKLLASTKNKTVSKQIKQMCADFLDQILD